MSQGSDNLSLDGYTVFINFLVKGFAQRDNVSSILGGRWHCRVRGVKPEFYLVKKVKPAPVDHVIRGWLIFSAEEDSG